MQDIKQWIQLFEAKQSREKTLVLEPLPYGMGDLDPVLSRANVEYHYGVLSRGYVNRYNAGEVMQISIMVVLNCTIYFGLNCKHPEAAICHRAQ